MRTALVTDSTACLPPYRVAQYGIEVVPVQVVIGDQTYDEGAGINSIGVAAALKAGAEVTTSRPAPERFAQLYTRLAASGFDQILSLHLSSELSGTYSAAVLAARECHIPVLAMDSRSVGLGLGFAVLAAANALNSGAPMGVAGDLAIERSKQSRIWLSVDTLDSLRRGGRVGNAQALVGSALAIKPILEVSGGKLELREKVRTNGRAAARMVELVSETAAEMGKSIQVGVQHANAADRASDLAREIGKALPGVPVVTTELGAVLTAHAGPGALSVVLAPA